MPHLSLNDGGRLFYEVQGTGPPLLLVSGLSGLASFWSPQMGPLAERFQVVVHDHRGTGASSQPRGATSIARMADDVLRLMDHLGLERASLIGHSTGGAIGQTLALDQPERIERLVLSGSWCAADDYFRRHFALRSEILKTMGPESYVRAGTLFLTPPAWQAQYPAVLAEEERRALEGFSAPEIVLARIAAILRFDRRDDLGRLLPPTLVIGARDDAVVPPHLSEDLARRIPGAKTVFLPFGGHFFRQPSIVTDWYCTVSIMEDGGYLQTRPQSYPLCGQDKPLDERVGYRMIPDPAGLWQRCMES